MATAGSPRAPRADAQRNRALIVAVAAEAFAESGLDVSMDAIAKSAGVGAGTLYRHFPTRDALLSAVLDAHGPELRAAADAIGAAGLDPGEALERWLGAVTAFMRAYEGLPEPLRAAHRERTSLTDRCEEVIATTDRFLAAAQRDGHARPGIRGRDLYLGALATAWATGAFSADESVEPGLLEMLRTGWATG